MYVDAVNQLFSLFGIVYTLENDLLIYQFY